MLDIIVIGKRKKKIVNFLGDGITKSLLKNHDGAYCVHVAIGHCCK